jgi:hypothetical protein
MTTATGGIASRFPEPGQFQKRIPASAGFDVSKNGWFLMLMPVENAAPATMTVVVNWTRGLEEISAPSFGTYQP